MIKKIIGKFFNYQTDPSFYDLDKVSVEVSEWDNIRSLHIGNDTIQSSMNLDDPFGLQLNYTKVMALVLIFKANPDDVLFVGLGGASLQKFFYKYCEKTTFKTLEIHPHVIQVAKSFFHCPEDKRMEIINTDGVAYLNDHNESYDLIISDAFDESGLPDIFRSDDYYQLCFERLKRKGIFLINFWGSDLKTKTYIKKIKKIFDNRVLFAAADNPGNIIVMAFKEEPKDLMINSLKEKVLAIENKTSENLMIFFNRLIDSAESKQGHRINF